MGILEPQLQQDYQHSVVVIGDCTVSPMEFMKTSALGEKINIIGFGGSSIREWYYLVRNNFDNLLKAKYVIIATSHPFRFRYGYHTYTSFLPFLMNWGDIYEYAMVEKRIYSSEMLRFYIAKIFKTYSASQNLRYSIFNSIFPNYPAWYQARNHMINENQQPSGWKAQTTINFRDSLNPDDNNEEEYMFRLAELNRKLGNRIVLVINSRSKRMITKEYLKEREVFQQDCAKHGMKCLIMTDAMPDARYPQEGDGLHIDTQEAIAEYWNKVERKIATL